MNKLITYIVNNKYYINNVALFVFCLCISSILMNGHEIWRDEAQSFLIVRDSVSVYDIFIRTVNEGHPILWHSLIFPIVHIFKSITAFQMFHVCVSSLMMYVILKTFPFCLKTRILIIFGYFFLYEYNVFSRSYSLSVLLIFLLLSAYNDKNNNFKSNAFLLFCLPNINAMSLIFSLCFVSVDLIFFIIRDKQYIKQKICVYASAFLGIYLSFVQILRAGTSHLEEYNSLSVALKSILSSFFPVPQMQVNFWQNCIVNNDYNIKVLCTAIVCLLLILYIYRLSKNKKIFVFFIVTSITYIMFFMFAYKCSIYHYGFIYITFLFCECALRKSGKILDTRKITNITIEKIFNIFFSAVLYIHAFSGVFAGLIDIKYEFSGAYAVSCFLKSASLLNVPISAYPDYLATGVIAYAGISSFYSPQTSIKQSYIDWEERKKLCKNSNESCNLTRQQSKLLDTDYILLTHTKISNKEEYLMFRTEAQICEDETMFVYLIKHQ